MPSWRRRRGVEVFFKLQVSPVPRVQPLSGRLTKLARNAVPDGAWQTKKQIGKRSLCSGFG